MKGKIVVGCKKTEEVITFIEKKGAIHENRYELSLTLSF